MRPLSQSVTVLEMKGFGLWQFRTFLLTSLMKVPTGWQMLSIVYMTPDPGTFWCATNLIANPCSLSCKEYNFTTHAVTFVTEWNLVCDRAHLMALSQVSLCLCLCVCVCVCFCVSQLFIGTLRYRDSRNREKLKNSRKQ